jgi:hypothetical protein
MIDRPGQIALSLQDLIHSHERLLSRVEDSDEHDRNRLFRVALASEIQELRARLAVQLRASGASEQEANQAASE